MAVLNLFSPRDVGLEGKVILSEGSGVNDLTSQLLRVEGVELVSSHNQVWERVEKQGAIVVPVDRAGVQWHWGQVALGHQGLGEVSGDVAGLGKVNAVPAHLCDNVLAEEHDLLGHELDATWIGGADS